MQCEACRRRQGTESIIDYDGEAHLVCLVCLEEADSPVWQLPTLTFHNHLKGGIQKMKNITIQIVGHERIRAFENTEKVSSKHPDFKADGVAVWVNESKKGEE